MLNAPKKRIRPLINATVAPDVDVAVRAHAQRRGLPISHAVEEVLRAGLDALNGGPPRAA